MSQRAQNAPKYLHGKHLLDRILRQQIQLTRHDKGDPSATRVYQDNKKLSVNRFFPDKKDPLVNRLSDDREDLFVEMVYHLRLRYRLTTLPIENGDVP